ncbi:hypothetical protein HYS94_00365 [Candidatus Daviesbacteria bacterium]|nr:hypothetical protein [Candidatus Daviesbacteria bacterium]
MSQKGHACRQAGFSVIFIVVGIGVLILTGVAAFLFKPNSKNQENPQLVTTQNEVGKVENLTTTQNSDEPPLKLKSIGVEFSDFKFTKEKLQFNRLFMGYGFVIPGNETTSGKDKSNPQPTFILPMGTPVRSLVDGVVANIPTVWSGDYSIQVTSSGKLERWVYETEHVINPKVKVGDMVKAGQIIAEVSDFDKSAPSGYGVVEIGILHGRGEGPPEHVCPFAYLDDSIKEETFTSLRNLFKDWEEYIGDKSLYDESLPTPGCISLDPIEG